ncbi:MAG: hypothetical protein ACOCUH_02475, partial [Bacteriovoracia bacterium]
MYKLTIILIILLITLIGCGQNSKPQKVDPKKLQEWQEQQEKEETQELQELQGDLKSSLKFLKSEVRQNSLTPKQATSHLYRSLTQVDTQIEPKTWNEVFTLLKEWNVDSEKIFHDIVDEAKGDVYEFLLKEKIVLYPLLLKLLQDSGHYFPKNSSPELKEKLVLALQTLYKEQSQITPWPLEALAPINTLLPSAMCLEIFHPSIASLNLSSAMSKDSKLLFGRILKELLKQKDQINFKLDVPFFDSTINYANFIVAQNDIANLITGMDMFQSLFDLPADKMNITLKKWCELWDRRTDFIMPALLEKLENLSEELEFTHPYNIFYNKRSKNILATTSLWEMEPCEQDKFCIYRKKIYQIEIARHNAAFSNHQNDYDNLQQLLKETLALRFQKVETQNLELKDLEEEIYIKPGIYNVVKVPTTLGTIRFSLLSMINTFGSDFKTMSKKLINPWIDTTPGQISSSNWQALAKDRGTKPTVRYSLQGHNHYWTLVNGKTPTTPPVAKQGQKGGEIVISSDKIQNLGIFVSVGGQGANGHKGLPSPLCRNGKYYPQKLTVGSKTRYSYQVHVGKRAYNC